MSYNKFKAIKTEYRGKTFDSKKEANYALRLDVLKKSTDINQRVEKYECQVPFEITLNGIKICKYILDFRVTFTSGKVEFVDVKGVKTPVYKLKKKLVEAQYGILIKEV